MRKIYALLGAVVCLGALAALKVYFCVGHFC